MEIDIKDNMDELVQKMVKVINAARLVVPTSSACPLIGPLNELDEYIDEEDAISFKRRIEK